MLNDLFESWNELFERFRLNLLLQSDYINKYGLIDELIFEEDIFEFSYFNLEHIQERMSLIFNLFPINFYIILTNLIKQQNGIPTNKKSL
jgi:hypothetical protein